MPRRSLIRKVLSGGVHGAHLLAFPPHSKALSHVLGVPYSPAHPDEPSTPVPSRNSYPLSSSPPQESEDAVKALAKEKDLLEREKWELRRQAKEATDHAAALRSQLDLKDNRMKELEAELAMVSMRRPLTRNRDHPEPPREKVGVSRLREAVGSMTLLS